MPLKFYFFLNVSIFFRFQEGDDYEIVPNSQFVISRTAFKDNSSYYQLDGKKVHFKEIAKLLRSHGVDLDHNRFLILQVISHFVYFSSTIAKNSIFPNLEIYSLNFIN